DLYALGIDWKGAWSFFVRLRRNARAIRGADYAGQKLPPNNRILDLGWSVRYNCVTLGSARPLGVSTHSNITSIGQFHSHRNRNRTSRAEYCLDNKLGFSNLRYNV